MENVVIRPLVPSDWSIVANIYKSGIDTNNATFETQIPSWENWDNSHLKFARIVALIKNQLVGWAALSPVSNRCVYGGVAEISVYVDEKHRSIGIGKALLENLIPLSEENGIWTLQAGIFRENISSIKLHESAGFRIVGYREKIGKLNGKWIDTYLLEKRSPTLGLD